MSITERRKGATAEREVVNLLHAHGFTHARRTSDGRAQHGRCDVVGVPGCAIEVKRQERLSVPAALDQLERDADPLDMPLLVHRPSRHDWMVTLKLEDLLPLLKLRDAA